WWERSARGASTATATCVLATRSRSDCSRRSVSRLAWSLQTRCPSARSSTSLPRSACTSPPGSPSRHFEAPSGHPPLDLLDDGLDHLDARVALRVGLDHVPRRVLVVGVLEHVLDRLLVLSALLTVAPIFRRQLPALQRIL